MASSSNTTKRFKYDVFLSFRGFDTRHTFTGNLWKSLHDRGIKTFIDDQNLQIGNQITPSLIEAIQSSNMAIIVLSKNYASSSFCLQELSNILDEIKDKGRLVLPVFYEVDPSDVRNLKRTYEEAMNKHEIRFNCDMDLLQKWKNALHRVSNLSGFHFKIGDEYEHVFIGTIVERVSREIIPVTLSVPDYLVGLKYPKQKITSLLNDGSDDAVHMVGIHGVGGIGKTTIAVEVYNSIVREFQGSCFLEKVRENSDKNGLIYLQKILLSQVFGEKNIELTSVRQGISILQQRLHQKKVLLLLDDVDKEEQLEAIAGRSDWFGCGSRVIITTRDKRLLICHGVERTYEVNGLCDEDAFELVRWKAFRNKFSPSNRDVSLVQKCESILNLNKLNSLSDFKTDEVLSGYADILKRVVAYASGLPLALEVIGSSFFNKTIEQCKYALDRYERVLDKKIQTILQLSFDALQEEEKSVFLDIACCFKGYKLTRVEQILHGHYGDSMKDHISVLAEKSLIKINWNHVTLHDLVEDMGKEIVRQESPKDPGNRSRLWASEDIVHVLEENTGTSKIEIICSNSRIEVDWDGEAFKKMGNLKTLIIMNGQLSESPKHLPNSLRILEHGLYPSWGLPSEFYPRKLAIFNVPLFMWGDFFRKKFNNMRVLNFDSHEFLTQIPNVSGLVNLEEFSFQNCVNLITIDDSVGLLGKLKILRAMHCVKLRYIPPLKLAYLEELDLSRCFSLESFPSLPNGLDKLKILRVRNCVKLWSIPPLKFILLEELDLSECVCLERFPPVPDALNKLKTLRVRSCTKLRSIPPLKLTLLEELDLSYCSSLESFPPVVDGFLGKLKILLVKSCYILTSIPPLKLDSLEKLDFSYCYNLESFPSVVAGLLDKLKSLSIDYCVMLRSIPPLRLTSLKRFSLSYCLSLESFPEILGKMRNIPELHFDKTPIKKFPFPFQNFTPPQTLYPCNCEIVSLPNRVAALSMLAEFTILAEVKVSPMQSSHVEYICLKNCILSDNYLSIGLMLFPNVKELHLSQICFTVLPKSIEKCHFLWRLVLDNCEKVREIKGIPPCLKSLSALNCKSLTLSCKSKLLNQELHEAGNTLFRLPRAKVPEWFDHQCLEGLSISFWFRNKFPAIVLCVVSPLTWNAHGPVRVIINDITFFYMNGHKECINANKVYTRAKVYHLHLFHMQMENFNDNMNKALLENKWNHAEVDFGFPFQKSGIHVLKEKSNMKDIRFTNPENDAFIDLTH